MLRSAPTPGTPGQTIGRDIGEVLQLPAQFRERLRSLGETRSHRADHQYRSPDGRLMEHAMDAAHRARER